MGPTRRLERHPFADPDGGVQYAPNGPDGVDDRPR
jgi:hypothetical protein